MKRLIPVAEVVLLISEALEEPFNLVRDLFPEQGGVTVAVEERPGPGAPVVYYHLDRQLALRQVDSSTSFVRVHAQLHTAGQLDHAYSAKELDGLKIQYLVNRIAEKPAWEAGAAHGAAPQGFRGKL